MLTAYRSIAGTLGLTSMRGGAVLQPPGKPNRFSENAAKRYRR